jgi:ATP-dependent RNA helicase DBP3
MTSTDVVSDKALKVAKKHLKKQESKSIKLKELAKYAAEKVGDDTTYKMVKKWIEKSDNFSVDGKIVSLTSKRERTVTPSSDGDEAQSSHSKKARKGEQESPSPSSSLSVTTWRTENKIVVMGTKDDEAGQNESKSLNADALYFPFQSFEDPACKKVMAECFLRQCTEGNGFTKPSPIQAQTWPIMMNSHGGRKRDVVGIAETGSGKTLAFAMPALTSMLAEKTETRRLPRMLVLAPTRELAMQSDQVLQEFGAVAGLRSLVVYGGVPKYTQTAELKKKNVDCVVATPGRVKDLINEGNCDLSKVQYLVLDEADRMLDMGFEEDVRYIISQCKPKEQGRQTAMFSATWPAAIQMIAMEYMVDPIRLYVGFESIIGSNGEDCIDDALAANKRVEQRVEVIEDRARDQRLRQILKQHPSNHRILIFALYKKEAQRMEDSLRRDGYKVCSIHGDKNQHARTSALAEFKDGTCPLLVATDVAARGLDIPNVEVVINFTFPLTIEDYIHRIGRTGRAGKKGISHTFFQTGDKSHAGELQQVMKQAGQNVPEALMKFGSTIKKKEHKLYGTHGPQGGGIMKKAVKITFDY